MLGLRLLVVLGSGGHTAQMLKLVEKLGKRFQYIYMIVKDDRLSEKKISIPGQVCYVHRARRHEDGLLVTIFKVLRLFVESIGILYRSNPDAIVSAGPGMAVPISLLGKLTGTKVIYIEDWSRVYQKSRTGKILYRFSDLFFVQWTELKEQYPKGIYAGRLS